MTIAFIKLGFIYSEGKRGCHDIHYNDTQKLTFSNPARFKSSWESMLKQDMIPYVILAS